jgi:hypothetical protein
MSASPEKGVKRCVGKPGLDVGELIAHRDFETAA